MNKHTTIRVINPHEETMPTSRLPGLWVEQLRRLGYVNVLAENDTHQVLEFPCRIPPRQIDQEAWAKSNAERMQSFGINAVTAPPWREHSASRIQAR